MNNQVRTEDAPVYAPAAEASREAEDGIIASAINILRKRLSIPGAAMGSPAIVSDYVRLRLACEKSERFAVLFLNSRHRILSFDILFQGTIDSAKVYPREVVKAALKHNAAACILVHNHPSGNTEPSQDDLTLTHRLKEALAMIDVRVLDHLIVGGSADMAVTSMAEHGYM